MHTARALVIGFALLIAVRAPECAAAPSELRGSIKNLARLAPGKSATVSLRTPEGLYEISLRRVHPRKEPLKLFDNTETAVASDEIKLYQGRILSRPARPLRSKLKGVAADIYQGKLTLRFYGERVLRLYTATFPLQSDSRVPGTIAHRPPQFPINCALDGGSHASTLGNLALVRSARTRRELEFAADLDAEFVAAAGGISAAAAELSQAMNVVNGIYADQLGVEVSLVAQNIFTDSGTQPYQTAEAEDLRDEVAAYRNTSPFPASVDATQLFTGKDLYLNDPGVGTGIVGISYLSIYPDYSDPGTVCRFDNEYSYTVVERYDSDTTYLGVLTAHELGHNLSLFHTNSGVMFYAPGPSNTTFSNSSATDVLAYIDSHGQCLTRLGPGVSLTLLRLRAGTFQARFAPSEYTGESCKLRLFGSGSRYDLVSDSRRHARARLLRAIKVKSTANLRFKAFVGSSTSRSRKEYYIVGEMFCDGQVTATSEVQSLRVNVPNFLPRLRTALRKR